MYPHLNQRRLRPFVSGWSGVELCRESTNFHLHYKTLPTRPHCSQPTLLPQRCHTSAAAAHQSPSTVEPNLGLEPNPQTLTSGQSLIVDRWFNVNNSSKQLIVLFKNSATTHQSPSSGEPGSKLPKLLPMHQLWKIWSIHHWSELNIQIIHPNMIFILWKAIRSLLIFLIFLLAQLTHYYYPAVCAINMGVIGV